MIDGEDREERKKNAAPCPSSLPHPLPHSKSAVVPLLATRCSPVSPPCWLALSKSVSTLLAVARRLGESMRNVEEREESEWGGEEQELADDKCGSLVASAKTGYYLGPHTSFIS